MSKDLYFDLPQTEHEIYYYSIIITTKPTQNDYENIDNNYQTDAIANEGTITNQINQEGCTEFILKK
jgi:hypothetical protein